MNEQDALGFALQNLYLAVSDVRAAIAATTDFERCLEAYKDLRELRPKLDLELLVLDKAEKLLGERV